MRIRLQRAKLTDLSCSALKSVAWGKGYLPRATLSQWFGASGIWVLRQTHSWDIQDCCDRQPWPKDSPKLCQIFLKLPDNPGHCHPTVSHFLLYFVSNLYHSLIISLSFPFHSQFPHTDLGAAIPLFRCDFFLRGSTEYN